MGRRSKKRSKERAQARARSKSADHRSAKTFEQEVMTQGTQSLDAKSVQPVVEVASANVPESTEIPSSPMPEEVARPVDSGPGWKTIAGVFGAFCIGLIGTAWNDLSGDLDRVESSTSGLDGRVISLEKDMATVRADVDNVKTGISDLKRGHESAAMKLDRMEALLLKLTARAGDGEDL